MGPKSYDKNLNILGMERPLKMKQKGFFIILKELSINQITQIFLEGESPTLMNSVSNSREGNRDLEVSSPFFKIRFCHINSSQQF